MSISSSSFTLVVGLGAMYFILGLPVGILFGTYIMYQNIQVYNHTCTCIQKRMFELINFKVKTTINFHEKKFLWEVGNENVTETKSNMG